MGRSYCGRVLLGKSLSVGEVGRVKRENSRARGKLESRPELESSRDHRARESSREGAFPFELHLVAFSFSRQLVQSVQASRLDRGNTFKRENSRERERTH